LALALKYYAIGNYKKAELEFKNFITNYKASKEILKAKYFRALSLIQLKELEQAKAILNEVSLEAPTSEWALKSKESLGQIYYMNGEFSQSIDVYNIVLKESKSDFVKAVTYEKLGISYIKTGQKSKGLEIFRKLISFYPNSDSAKRIKKIYF